MPTALSGDLAATGRGYRGERDYRLVRELLVASYPITPFGLNWEVRRLDGWFWQHADDDRARRGPCADVRLWTLGDDRLVGAVFSEDGRGDAHLQVHPDHRGLETEMVAWAEANLAAPADGGGLRLDVPALEDDEYRLDLLDRRGYRPVWNEMCRRMPLEPGSPPDRRPVEGYRIRGLRPGDAVDHQRVADVLNAGFGRSSHTAAWFATLTRSPAYRAELHLVAETPDGAFASFVGVTYDPENRRGIVEPVCTDPAHRRRGLAAALLVEGIRRVAALGAVEMILGTGDDPGTNAFYAGLGFTEAHRVLVRRRLFDGPS